MKYDAWMCQCEVSVFCIQGKLRGVIPKSCLVNKTHPQYDRLHQNKMCFFAMETTVDNFIPNVHKIHRFIVQKLGSKNPNQPTEKDSQRKHLQFFVFSAKDWDTLEQQSMEVGDVQWKITAFDGRYIFKCCFFPLSSYFLGV